MTPEELREIAGPFCVICHRPDHECDDAFVDQCDQLKAYLHQAADRIEELERERDEASEAWVNEIKVSARRQQALFQEEERSASLQSERNQARAQVEALTRERNDAIFRAKSWEDKVLRYGAEVSEARADATRLRATVNLLATALRWYADQHNYDAYAQAGVDTRAREALKSAGMAEQAAGLEGE